MATRKQKKARKTVFWRSRNAKIILGIVLFIIAARIALPYILLNYANKTLAHVDGYYGHVDDIDVALLRGAYVLDSFYLNKVDSTSGKQTPFLSSRTIDLSLEWGALFHGRVVGELVFEQPQLRFTENKVELAQVSKDTTDFRELLRDFMPVEVNRCEIRDGDLRYIDETASPKVDVSISHLDALATNLKNAYKKNEVLPSTLDANGEVYGGTMKLGMKLNPLAKRPQFDLNANVEKTKLVELNDFFKAYAGFDVNKGEFNMYTEAATKDGKFAGYVKPIIRDLDVVSWQGQDKKDNFFQKVWESVVGGVGEIFENKKKDQIATKIEFRGSIDNPRANVFQSIVMVVQNAFVQALRPSIDNQINLQKLAKEDEEKKGGIFKALFSSGKDKDGEKKEKREKKD